MNRHKNDMQPARKFGALVALALFLLGTRFANADDTELYVNQVSGTGSPKVLIILDNSGSMSTIVAGSRPAYEPGTTYTSQGSISSTRVYWSTSGTPPSSNSDNYFLLDSNRCASSANALTTTGTYTDYMIAWRQTKNTWGWRTVNDSNGTRASQYVDCKTDITANNPRNPGSPAQADGYPTTSSGPYVSSGDENDHHGEADGNGISFSGSNVITLFSANYMNWYHNADLSGDKPRMDIAKEVVTGIVNANPGVDFGLMIFNNNNQTPHGGRLVYKINNSMTETQRGELLTLVDGLNAETYTPLCETLYEAYRYYGGLDVYYGDDASSPSPARDTTAENAGKYVSPMGDCQQAYVILMTDGEPTNDTHADTPIGALPGIGTVSGNRLDELAGWLYSTDLDNDSSNGVQRVVTYTIGFQTNHALLSDAAKKGGGQYYTATNSTELTNAFQGALNAILQTSTTFTAPSVAVNSFNRSRSLDDIFMAMFKPKTGPRWHGNLKKLRIDSDGNLVDANGVAAIDPTTGDIRDTAQTLWSTTTDGNDVEKGGTGALLAARDPSSRVIKTNTGAQGALESFAMDNNKLTATLFGAADDTEKDELISWARGVDVDDDDDDESTTDTRPWVLGDPLHSRPLVLNYGARGAYTAENPDIRVLMGTNHAVLHMFGADNGAEDWAFIPKEMLSVVRTVRNNHTSDTHPYGLDGTIVPYVYDKNRDGTISGADDKVYIFFGLRRGGSAYYALDISDPDNPSFMWRIDETVAGFEELGQTWSAPVVTYVPGNTTPVLIVGAGFDTNKDASGIGTADSSGRGIFVIDALDGRLVWSVTPAASGNKNLQHTALTDSIPAPVAVLDSNGDGAADRIYVGDTGGNVWRVDLPGNALPQPAQTTWSMFKFAALGGDTATADRRFFNQIDVVRTRDGNLSFDAVNIGSGDRPHPNERNVSNRFYMLRDTDIYSAYYGTDGKAVPAALTEANLYDATSNLIQDGTTAEKEAAVALLRDSRGWFMALERSGEKNLASSLTLNGVVFFTTFAPDTTISACIPIPGVGYLYAVKLQNAAAVYDWNATDTVTKADRAVEVGNRLPDSVTPHFGEDTIRIIGVGAGDGGSGSHDTNAKIRTIGTYWFDSKQ